MIRIMVAASIGAAWWFWPTVGPWVHAAIDHLPRVPAPDQRPAPSSSPAQPQSDVELDYRILIGNIDHEWQLIFQENGLTYRKPVLVLYSGQTSAGCTGRADARMGPFYCPEDQKIYVPTSLSREVEQRSGCQGAPCQFIQAAGAAHEVGHHVEYLLGLMNRGAGGPRIELMADCLSGVWARHEDDRLKKEGKPALVEPGDIEAALRWQAAIGDDVLMRQAGQPIDPSRFTHGSSAQRQQAFRTGWQQGTLASCNTRGRA
jgi:predicted metalloprotease